MREVDVLERASWAGGEGGKYREAVERMVGGWVQGSGCP